MFSAATYYLGHTNTMGRLQLIAKTKETICKLKYHTNTREMGLSLGLCNVYRGPVSNLATKAEHLNNFVKKGKRTNFNFDGESKAAVNDLQDNMISLSKRALHKKDTPFTIETDTCDKQIGWILPEPQQDETDFQPVKYWSRTLNDVEEQYGTIQQDLLAVTWALFDALTVH